MQITLNQAEIEEAVLDHVHSQVEIQDSQELVIDLKAGRGENGFTATININPRNVGVVDTDPIAKGPSLTGVVTVATAPESDSLDSVPVANVPEQGIVTGTKNGKPGTAKPRKPRKGSKAALMAEAQAAHEAAAMAEAEITKTEAPSTPGNEEVAGPSPVDTPKTSIFGSPKLVKTSTEELGIPDQETPTQEAAREDATGGISTEAPPEEVAAAPKKSIFNLGPKVAAS